MNYILTVSLLILLLYFSIKKTTSNSLLLSPSLVMVLVFCTSLGFPSLIYLDELSSGFFTIYYCAYISILLMVIFIDDSKGIKNLFLREGKLSLNRVVTGGFTFIYVFILVVDLVQLISSYGGIIGALTRQRLDEYLTDGIKSGSFNQLLLLVPTVAYYIKIGELYNDGKLFKSFSLVMFTVLYYTITANTRLPIIMPLVAFLVYFAFQNLPLFTKKFGLTLVLLSMFILSVFSFFANLLRHGISSFEGSIIVAMNEQNLNQLKYPLWIERLYDYIDRGILDYDFGYTWIVIPTMNFIPRGLWPEKPLTSTSNILSEKVYGITVGDGSPITTFTIWGEGYWQFGIFGVLFATFLFYFCFYVISSLFSKFKNTEIYILFTLVSWLPFVRAEQPIFHLLTSILSLLVLVVISDFFNSIKIGYSNDSR